MIKKNWFLMMAMLFAFSLILVACGGGEAGQEENTGEGTEGGETTEGSSEDPEFISILTGGTEGTYYPLGGTFAQIFNDNLENIEEATAQSTGASVENMTTMKNGDAEVAFTQTDIAAYAAEGTMMFEGEPIDNVQAIGTLYPETIQIVAAADAGIETVADLEGKTVSVGAIGSGTNANATDILEVYGLTMDDITARDLAFGDSTSGIQDGTIDAAFITSGTPTGAVESLAATTDITIVPVEEEKAQQLIDEKPYYSVDEVPEGTYSLEEAVPTVAVQAMLVASADISEDLVYNMTKALFENTDQISHPKGEFISAETALDGVGIEVHPGAQRYFDEKGIEQ